MLAIKPRLHRQGSVSKSGTGVRCSYKFRGFLFKYNWRFTCTGGQGGETLRMQLDSACCKIFKVFKGCETQQKGEKRRETKERKRRYILDTDFERTFLKRGHHAGGNGVIRMPIKSVAFHPEPFNFLPR